MFFYRLYSKKGDIMKNKTVKRRILFTGVVLLILPFLSSCATDEKFAYTNDQINAANRKIASLEETIDRTIDQKLSNMNSNQADLRLEIDQLKEEISSLSGRVEESEYLVKHSLEKDLTSQDTLSSELSDISSRVAELETSVAQQRSYLNLEDVQEEGGMEGMPGPETGEGMEQPSEEQYLYDTYYSQYREGKYNESLEGFKSFLEQFPKSDLADNAQFWIGECYMSIKDYKQAILAFEDVIKKYPKGNKVPNAMLRQAIAFLEYDDKDSCTIILKNLIKKYPDSNEAQVAQKKLDMMK